jgi:5'-nucleotidase
MRLKKITAVIVAGAMMCFTAAVPAFADEAEQDSVIIYHTNDVHGYYQGTDEIVGHDVIAGIYETSKETEDSTFLVSAGDMIQGTYFVNNNKGEAAMEIMSAAGYQVMAPGNHEFDYGTDRILELRNLYPNPEFMTQASFSGIHWAAPQIFETGGHTVGFFGITTPETVRSSYGGKDVDFGTFEDVISYADDTAKALREDGADLVVCVAHMGIIDEGFGDSYQLRDKTEGIDLFIDGHSHTPLADIEAAEADKPLIVSAGEYATFLGKVTLTQNDDGSWTAHAESLTPAEANAVPLSEGGKAKAAEVKAIIDKWAAHEKEMGETVVAHNENAMAAVREELRSQETVLGDFIADAIRNVSGADIAVMNGGSIRADLPAGDVTVADINNVLPYVNFILMAEIDGKTVREVLETSVSRYPELSGGFLQVSGVSFTYNPEAEAGSRVVSVTVGDKPLDDNASYTFATNDWISGGGDGYTMLEAVFANTLPLAHPEITSLTDAVTWYIGTDPAIPAIPAISGRISQVSADTTVTTVPATGNTSIAVIAVVAILAIAGFALTRKKTVNINGGTFYVSDHNSKSEHGRADRRLR